LAKMTVTFGQEKVRSDKRMASGEGERRDP
jgi:hypothetical protein